MRHIGAILLLSLLVSAPGFQAATPTDDPPQRLRLSGDWGGQRTRLETRGLDFNLFYVHYVGSQLRGGADDRSARRQSASTDILVHADLERMGYGHGGELFAHVKSNYGKNINPFIGALSDPLDDADFDDVLYVDQLWYQQSFRCRGCRLRIGYLDQQTILDRNAFANSEDKQFLSTTLDNNITVPLKIGFGATMFLAPCKRVQLVIGTADADNKIRVAGLDTTFDDFESLMGYFELGLVEKRGKWRFGGYYDPRRMTIFAVTPPNSPVPMEKAHVGFYSSADHVLWKSPRRTERLLGAFLRLGLRNDDVHKIDRLASFGLALQGLPAGPGVRPATLGLGFYSAHVSDRYREAVNPDSDTETGIELYYTMHLTPWLVVTPDLQFIDNPGGLESVDDALVFNLRGRITF